MVISGTSVVLNSQLQMAFFVILLIALSVWILQHRTLAANHKGSLTASVKPHACKMYVLTVSPYTCRCHKVKICDICHQTFDVHVMDVSLMK